MGTFFDKLTGYRSDQPTTQLAVATEVKPDPSRLSRRPQSSPISQAAPIDPAPTVKPPRLRVPDDPAPALPPRDPLPEDEGELTVDIYDAGDAIVIQSTVAGVKPEDLDVSITNDSVTIRGRRERSQEIRDDDYYYKELFWGSFARSVILPEEIEEDAAEATLKLGLLSIRLPKKQRGVAQKLKVKSV